MTRSGWKSSSVCFWAIASVAASWWGIIPSRAEASNDKVFIITEISNLPTFSHTPPLQEGNKETRKVKEKQESLIAIAAVKVNPTEKGIELILETTLGEQLQIVNRTKDNNFVADIQGAQLRSPSREAFTFNSSQPSEGITQISVANLDDKTVRVTITGQTTLPTVELFDSPEGLILSASATVAQTPPSSPYKGRFFTKGEVKAQLRGKSKTEVNGNLSQMKLNQHLKE
jgi:AMIN domain